MKLTISNKRVPIIFTGFNHFSLLLEDNREFCRVSFRAGDHAAENKARITCEFIKEAVEHYAEEHNV